MKFKIPGWQVLGYALTNLLQIVLLTCFTGEVAQYGGRERAKRNPYVKISLIAVKCNVGSSPKKSQNLENSI